MVETALLPSLYKQDWLYCAQKLKSTCLDSIAVKTGWIMSPNDITEDSCSWYETTIFRSINMST